MSHLPLIDKQIRYSVSKSGPLTQRSANGRWDALEVRTSLLDSTPICSHRNTMDLTSLTRPAILAQCLRCSSSLAVLENEWARLSNSYSIAAAWVSVNFQRISIASDKKQIPQTSDMSLLRGRIIQEVSCKLCQQKLGVLCGLDNG